MCAECLQAFDSVDVFTKHECQTNTIDKQESSFPLEEGKSTHECRTSLIKFSRQSPHKRALQLCYSLKTNGEMSTVYEKFIGTSYTIRSTRSQTIVQSHLILSIKSVQECFNPRNVDWVNLVGYYGSEE